MISAQIMYTCMQGAGLISKQHLSTRGLTAFDTRNVCRSMDLVEGRGLISEERNVSSTDTFKSEQSFLL